MRKLAKRVLPAIMVLIALSVPVLCQQEVDPSYYAPVPDTSAQGLSRPVIQTTSAPKRDPKPALLSTAYHANVSRAKVRKSAAVTSGRKNSTRK